MIFNRINARFEEIQERINLLHQKLNTLKVEQKPAEIPIKQPETAPIKPVEVPKPIITVVPPAPIKETIVPKPEPIIIKPAAHAINTPKAVQVPKKSWYETFKENNPDLEKFIGENLINKIGILILVLGISFFVKFAIDKDWINEPARVGIGVLCGALVMGIAHKLKKNYAAFSSVLVAGAISIFYFTIAIAFHEYQLFSQTVAFAIMVVITAFATLVSVSYNRQELAVLSLIGGFAVPFMLSTGEGNYIVLFTYIAILNVGILAISYFKKWKIVTVLAFAFTSLLYGSWLGIELWDKKLPHLNALLFATLFYFIFSVTIVLHNIRNKGALSVIEYIILIANTFLFFSVGMTIIHSWGSNFKGLFTLLLAFYNMIYAFILYKKFGLDKNAIYLLIGLALTFVTLTIPIQFEGNQITLFWAAEAVLLFWLSQKSKINSFKFGAIVVQGLTLFSLLMDWGKYAYPEKPLSILLNPLFIAGIVVCASLIFTQFVLKKEEGSSKIFGIAFNPSLYSKAIGIAAILVGYITGILEITYQANQYLSNSASALSFSVVYHFVFSTVLLFVVSKQNKRVFTDLMLMVGIINLVLYIGYMYKLPNTELVENIVETSTTKYAFYFHYIILACLVYVEYQLFKRTQITPKLNLLHLKIMPWLFAFAIVYVLSNEVMLHSLNFTSNVVNNTELAKQFPNENATDYYYNLDKTDFIEAQYSSVKRQIIKIGYPILWGVFAFVFLIIGIKRQWKTLRIIALSLLGLTIVKLFAYDINNVSETGKIIAFILLGVLILIISFVYQKIKKLVVDETPKNTEPNEN
ncbi:DUF2339 domain-containing protein [Mariniflexile jejuense]|uniref:DUF2339 domain-containing protein n=1 Tax=Mariniflexile jejuense TaxID=1173582 RepID=A0ABW3JGN9_9FLAO